MRSGGVETVFCVHSSPMRVSSIRARYSFLDLRETTGKTRRRLLHAMEKYAVGDDMKRRNIWIMALALLCAVWVNPGYSKEKKSQKQPPAASSSAPVDLNTAGESELDKLPGVGTATAKKIIAGRPYSSVGDLSRAGIPAKTIEKITPMVTVNQSRVRSKFPVESAA